MKKFIIHSEFITLGQLLKATDHIGSGGEAKFFLLKNDVFVNQEKRIERGKKLYNNDIVEIKKQQYIIIYDQKNHS